MTLTPQLIPVLKMMIIRLQGLVFWLEQKSFKKEVSRFVARTTDETSSLVQTEAEPVSQIVAMTENVVSLPVTPLQVRADPCQRLSDKGVNLLKQFEGFRAQPYYCSANHLTIGYGHLIKDGELFTHLTQTQGEKLLKVDVEIFEDVIRRHTLTLNQNQFDALTCLVFNIGQTQFEASKTLKYLQAQNLERAVVEWAGFNKIRNKQGKLVVCPGLVRRRAAELNLFNTPC